MRPPTADEIRGLVDDYIREEVYYREALALGLDRDDTVIRRRLRQKMEFVSGDLAAASEPTDAELQTFLESHPGAFQLPAIIDFQQVFFSSDRRGEQALAQARRERRSWRAPATALPHPTGDPSLLPAEMSRVDATGRRQRLWRSICRRDGGRAARPLDRPGAIAVRGAHGAALERKAGSPAERSPRFARRCCASGRPRVRRMSTRPSTAGCSTSTTCASKASSASCCSARQRGSAVAPADEGG